MDIESESDDITLDKAYPISDVDGESLKPYKFSVHNKCSDMATYQINLESLSKVLEANRLSPNYLKVKLNEVGQVGIEKVLGETSPTDTTIGNTYEAHKLMDGYLEGNETKNFELRIWMHEKVTVENVDSMNKEFRSKITVTSTYINEDDIPPTSSLALSVCDDTITATATATPYKNKNIQKYEYKIDEEAWQDGSETQEFPEQLEGDHTIKLRVTDNKGAISDEVEQTVNVVAPEMVEIAGKQIKVATCKNGLYKVEHNDLEELGQEWNQAEYRYAGVNYTDAGTPYVHNYVSFNNEIWRIIGLVNVKTDSGVEQRVKIVRTDGVGNQKDFGNYSWNANWTSNWTEATLKDMLNGIYYESGIGECCTGDSNTYGDQKTCDFSLGTDLPKGLDDTARNMIDSEVIWNVSGSHGDETVNLNYEKERSSISPSYDSYAEFPEYYPSEWSDETDVGDKHNGIGLIYPSDFGYATNGGKFGRQLCLNKKLYDEYGKNDYWAKGKECYENNWLKPDKYLFTLFTSLATGTDVFFIDPDYGLGSGSDTAANTEAVWPTAYLTKNVTITSGEGTIDEPYELQLNA